MKAEHAELAMQTYVDDLEAYDPLFVDLACQKWRTTPGNKFFPTIGELMTFIVPLSQKQADFERPVLERGRLPKPDMRYVGKYEGWESWTDMEKCKRIALDINELEKRGTLQALKTASLGKALLEREGWKT